MTPQWPDWSGQTAVCIATGPSLTREQVETVRSASVRVIGINDIGITEKWIDIWYAADWKFWKHYSNVQSEALKVSASLDGSMSHLIDLFLSTNNDERAKQYIPGHAINGGHSGFQALQIAISLGAGRVVLLGYDCKAQGQKTNYFGTKCASLHKDSPYAAWTKFYRDLNVPDGVEVLNATPGSAIDAYTFVDVQCLQ